MTEKLRAVRIKRKRTDGIITTAGRRALRRSQFALPPTAEQRRRGIKGRYPIPDIAHGRNALARVSTHGTPYEREMVRRAVYKKFPSLRK